MGNPFADVTWLVCLGAEAAMILASRRQALRDPSHLPIPYLFSYVLVADTAMRMLRPVLHGAPRPFSGLARIAYHAETALFRGWPCALAAVALWVFLPNLRKYLPFLPLGAWLGLKTGMVLQYPITGVATARVFLVVEIAVLACVALATTAGWYGKWGPVHRAVLFLTGAEAVVTFIGPYATSIYRDWAIATVIYAFAFAGLAAWYLLLSLLPPRDT